MSQQKKNVLPWMGVHSFWIMFCVCIPECMYAQKTCPEVRQQFLNDGFHRNLLIKINLSTADESIGSCIVAIKVHFPKGLYVDPYELTSLKKHNLTEALVIADNVDLEAPEYLAADISVLVYMRPDPECFSCFRALLPLHCRYHRPAENDGEISTVLKSPELLIHCRKSLLSLECLKETEIEAPCSQKDMHMCHWDSMKFETVNKELKLQIPVGLKYHLTLVCTVTLATTILCSSLILSAIYKHGCFSFIQSSW
ncbi:phosphatidylinositol-glycan biosynthesis class X protein [Rhineura floridana]|uniref:phosphatidylinositol-glycan biosynthesis class X protein n=1 Tax=Rhineura floridana TaxID=261503 RepID=UPI002AC870CC|nr:phosphatidylinositol-glycan biosynthesis class X protein [Rhineura floridana]XP_061492594.1 phosphatidylinositol-glycan biosynthesis class X protein [Rhineura floridana]XP_061492595.1 phosphatidylinositol-glycan biosynthesis class X protein [Rhineura floridana]XP_061492596.1 phosphatidylinositol-glycan biosynthesis class X protein [Rhineura floridana]XP_061492597.1 phosphatidylinositol-glycan biosynthesis class X protein [Rhineura floridana]